MLGLASTRAEAFWTAGAGLQAWPRERDRPHQLHRPAQPLRTFLCIAANHTQQFLLSKSKLQAFTWLCM